MFGSDHRVNAVESRKQLLVAESELNRARLAEDLIGLKEDLCAFNRRAQSLGSIVKSAAVLVAGVTAFRRGKSTAIGKTSSWTQTNLNGAGLISSLCLAFRSRGGQK